MTEQAQGAPAVSVSRAERGRRLGGYIYGTIIVLSVLVAGARAYPHEAGHIAVLVGVTSVVFWLAHVYSHALAHSVSHDEHLSFAALLEIARREASIVEAALPPIAPLLLGAFGVISTAAAVWAALGLGLAVLAAQGVAFARVERLGWVGTLVVVGVNVGLGVLLAALKLALSH
jgi:hypothetical protein